MKTTLSLFSLLAVIAVAPAQATVTLNFNSPFSGGVSSNLANKEGIVSNGLTWGILIDPTGTNTFPTTNDRTQVIPGATTTLSGGNILILAATGTFTTAPYLEGDFATFGGDGGVGSLVSIPLSNAAAGISPGDQFRLVWFDPEVNSFGMRYYGFIDSATFTIPADGSTLDYATPFLGVDPVRPAFGSYLIVPEPAVPLLSLLGLAGLIRRRR